MRETAKLKCEMLVEYIDKRETSLLSRNTPICPPKFLEAIFWLLLPRKLRDAIMGDAAEAFAQTMNRYPGRRVFATADYCKEALFAIFGAMRLSLAQCIGQMFRKSS